MAFQRVYLDNLPGTPTIVFTAAQSTLIPVINLKNNSQSDVTFTIGILKNGDVLGDEFVIDSQSLTSGHPLSINVLHILETGDSLALSASAADSIVCEVNGDLR